MDMVRPVLAALAVVLAGLAGALAVGTVVSRYDVPDLLRVVAVALPAVGAAFLAGGIAARVHPPPHRHRPGRHLLAAVLGPLLVGIAGAAGVERGIDFELTARALNLVLPAGAAAAGARLLDRGGAGRPVPVGADR